SPPITTPPKCPRHLKGTARDHWRRLTKILIGTIRESDLPALEHFVTDLARLDALRETIEKQGATYESRTAAGALMYRVRPEVPMEKALASRVKEWLASFGLTPASKSRVMTVPLVDEDDPLAAFLPKSKSRI